MTINQHQIPIQSQSQSQLHHPPINTNTNTTELTSYSPVLHVPASSLCIPGSFAAYCSNFLSGAIALSTAFAAVHPIDTLRAQLQSDLSLTPRKILSNRQLLYSLMNGFNASVGFAGLQGGIRLSTYEHTKLYLFNHYNSVNNNQSNNSHLINLFCSGAAAVSGDIASSIIKVPREVITINMQTTTTNGNNYLSTRSVINNIYSSTAGWRGFYTGYCSTALRDTPFMILLFTCYENMKFITGTTIATDSIITAAGIGAISGGLAAFATAPADLLKTQIVLHAKQQLLTAGNNSNSIYNPLTIAQAYNRVISTTGYRGLFRGSIARSLWWFGVTGIFFPIYEYCKTRLHSNHIAIDKQ